jgi:hypothetical protein
MNAPGGVSIGGGGGMGTSLKSTTTPDITNISPSSAPEILAAIFMAMDCYISGRSFKTILFLDDERRLQ